MRKLDTRDLAAADTEQMVREVLRPDLVEEFHRTNEADFAYSLAGVGRFRVNAFRARGAAGLVFRRVSIGAIPLDDLGLPPVLAQLALEPRGLVLVTGPTGCGKTTTLAGMVDTINMHREVHIVTIEDPIEVLHFDKTAMVNQREVRVDTEDFATALRAAMRQDPDVILVGEMRDQETVKAALAAAETGHFVMSTLHTTDATETVNRVIDFFPPHRGPSAAISVAARVPPARLDRDDRACRRRRRHGCRAGQRGRAGAGTPRVLALCEAATVAALAAISTRRSPRWARGWRSTTIGPPARRFRAGHGAWEVAGRRLVFEVAVTEPDGPVASAVIVRAVVPRARFDGGQAFRPARRFGLRTALCSWRTSTIGSGGSPCTAAS